MAELRARTDTHFCVASDAPESTDLYWTNRTEEVRVGFTYNLTCESTWSRPVATFRWSRDGVDVTRDAYEEQNVSDADGTRMR